MQSKSQIENVKTASRTVQYSTVQYSTVQYNTVFQVHVFSFMDVYEYNSQHSKQSAQQISQKIRDLTMRRTAYWTQTNQNNDGKDRN